MAIEPIFEKVLISGKSRAQGEVVKAECKTMVSTDTVSEVLSVTANAFALGVEEKDGQIKCDGRAILYICYLSSDGEIKKTESSADFSSIISVPNKTNYKATCKAQVVKTDYDLTGASLGATATVQVSAEILENVEVNALSGGDKLVIDNTELTFSKCYGVREGTYPLEEEFELNCEIKEILFHRASVTVSSVNCAVGSITVDGQIYLSLIALQKAEKSSIIKEVRVIPFHYELEYDDAMPNAWATASATLKGLKTDVISYEESAKSKVTVSLNLHFTGEVWIKEERQVVRDAFSITDDVEIINAQTDCFKPSGSACVTTAFNGRAVTKELPVGVSMFAVGNEGVEVVSSELVNGKLKATGVITAIGYFCDGEGKPFTRKLETTFEKEVDCNLIGELDHIQARAERTTARLISATEIELDGELILCPSSREKTTARCVCEVKGLGEKKPNTHAISVYIPMEDEELWSLSKRLNVCPESLVETNPDLTFPLTGNERIVVYRKL